MAYNKLSWPERIRKRADETNDGGCWLWPANQCNNYGYGQTYVSMGDGKKKGWLAHRWSYTVHVGPIPEGLQIDHLCRNRRCVNPEHLEPVTPGENIRRATPPIGDQCVRGHSRAEHGYVNSQGNPVCRGCSRETWAQMGRTRQRAGMLSAGQVAKMAGKPKRWVDYKAERGVMPPPDATTLGGQRLWARSTIEEWLAAALRAA